MANMKINGATLNVVVDGPEDAPALLMSNSLGSNLSMWDPQMASLARRFRVIRYDSRGHGASEVTPGPYSVEQLGRDALGVLDAVGVEKAHFIGLSLGGVVGMWLLLNAPERIDRAVLSNTSAHFGNPDSWNARIRTAMAEGLDGLADATMDRWFTADFQEAHPETVARIADAFRATAPEGFCAAAAAIRDCDLREAIRSISNRVLVIVGTQDPSATPSAGGLIAEHIPGARLVALEAAHLSNTQAENEFNRAVVAFLTAPAAQPKAERKAEPAARVKAAKKSAKKTAKKAAKAGTAKKAAAKKSAAKKAPAKKGGAKKSVAKKAAAKKTAAKKSAGKKASARKVAGKKTAKSSSTRTAAKKTAKKAAVKTPARKSVKKAVKQAGTKTATKIAKKTAKTSAKKSARKAAKKSRR
ncbi:MAG: 3-oxoadipate enol-lactonase [Hyphomicrobiales bacterium]|nr:3-oxoadipate enol-lactonase [Hyphomicrobiales bacterium]